MSLNLNNDYEQGLRMAKPTFLQQYMIKPPPGALGAITIIPPQTIPPINTNIQFSTLPVFKTSQYPGLAAIDYTKLPENFNWRENGDPKKRRNLSKPGNQMLCGSCWAISTAGIVADNHVIANTVNWNPNLSTTWCLACFPQYKCEGGNPAKLFQDISQHGIATNHCVDYSWCSQNESCNGSGTKHFDPKTTNLSNLVPDCGCYDSNAKHYLYFIDPPTSLALDRGDMTKDNFAITVKKHIYQYGPLQGGFLVFKNFRSGAFSKVNGGVYLETGIYDGGNLKFDNSQVDSANYVGSHAIAIIGWGIEKGITIDNNNTKADVPYWYCRNSWGETWGDGGYFKMAMYPYNKISQFDKMIQINTPSGTALSGAMVSIKASKPPVLQTLTQISKKFTELTREQKETYYNTESHEQDVGSKKSSEFFHVVFGVLKYVLIYFSILLVVLFIVSLSRKYFHHFSKIKKPKFLQKSTQKSSHKSLHTPIKTRNYTFTKPADVI